jgi:Actin like proteins N terminal domain
VYPQEFFLFPKYFVTKTCTPCANKIAFKLVFSGVYPVVDVAMDAGLGAFKVLPLNKGKNESQIECHLLESVISPVRTAGFGEEPLLTIKLDGVETLVGADARTSKMARNCWASGKVSPDVQRLALASLALVARKMGVQYLDIKLASALPVGLWATHRENLAKLLKGRHNFQMQGKDYCIDIEFSPDQILPEPYCTFLYLKESGVISSGQSIGIVDVGHSTVDFALMNEQGRFISEHSSHRDIGMRVFYDALDEAVSNLTGDYMGPVSLEKMYIANQQELSRLGQTHQLKDLYTEVKLHYGEQLLNALKQIWKGVPLDQIVLTGGGASTVVDVFAEACSRLADMPKEQVLQNALKADRNAILIVAPNARTANVRGLATWLAKQDKAAA